MAELSLPHASITKIPNMAPATPTLWNSAYTEIDENFAAIKTKVNSLDQATQAASESSSGIVQLATSDEVIAGTEETKVVTPAGLRTLVATETRKGLVDLATENDFDTYAEETNPVEVKKVGTVASIVKWVKKAIAKAVAAAILAAIPPGTVIYYLGDDIPNGFLLTNGASVLKTDFPLLYAAIGDKFGNVDDQHFNLPNTHHRFLEGTTNIEEVGTYVSAGLPNIPVGSLPVISYNHKDPELPFKVLSRYGDYVTTDQITSRYWQNTQVGFDLQASNPIYGASDTVRPDALMGYWMIRF